jgi:alpha-beta hydrolase superfamily lysophospholipase
MKIDTIAAPAVVASWDEPAGGTPRGTLILLPGRGETAASYERFGRRLSADAYRVRLVSVDLGDLDAAREAVEALVADESLPSPKVLVGSDTGAALAATLADRADGAVIAGRAIPASREVGDWEAAVEARTACPVHRRVIGEDEGYDRAALARPVPAELGEIPVPRKPVLVLHGTADVITPISDAVAPYDGAARIRLVDGGRHDILNDLSHRSVAATIVLFLESLRLGPELPDIVLDGAPA